MDLSKKSRERWITVIDDDIQIEIDIVPLTVESAIRFAIGRKLLRDTIRYLEEKYGRSQEAEAIELLEEAAIKH